MKKLAPKYMTKPTGRLPKQIGVITLKEVPYKDGWVVDLTWRGADAPSGRGHRTRNNWRHAEQFAEKENKRIEELKAKGEGRYTFNDAADSFVARTQKRLNRQEPDIYPETLDRYITSLDRHARPKFGNMLLQDIKAQMVADWLEDQSAKHKHKTLIRDRDIVSKVLGEAVKRGWLVAKPDMSLCKVPGKKKKREDWPERSDLEALREIIDAPRTGQQKQWVHSSKRVMLVLGGSCGMRVGEVAALRWDAIDPETGEIEIREQLTRDGERRPPKTGKIRKVPTSLRARAILEEHAVLTRQLSNGKLTGSVLKTRDGKDVALQSVVHMWFRRAMKDAGLIKPDGKLKFAFHGLRHSCAERWVPGTNGDIVLVSKWLGHASAKMTLDVYGHARDDADARKKMEQMPDWLTPVLNKPLEDFTVAEPAIAPVPPVALPALSAINGQITASKPEVDCPIYIPHSAERWLGIFIRAFWKDGHLMNAKRAAGRTGTQIWKELRRNNLPTMHQLQEMRVGNMEIPEQFTKPQVDMPPGICSIDVPDLAAPWVKQLIELLEQGMDVKAAYEQIGKTAVKVYEEFERIGLPHPGEVKRRIRDKKIMHWHGLGYQAADVALKVGCHVSRVWKLCGELHKPSHYKSLNPHRKNPNPLAGKTQSEHKTQLKLL